MQLAYDNQIIPQPWEMAMNMQMQYTLGERNAASEGKTLNKLSKITNLKN